MGEYQTIAETIAECISERQLDGGVRPDELAEIGVRSAHQGEAINCYPGRPDHECYPFALFISLNSPDYVRSKRGHLSCRQAMEKVVQHMQGSCFQRTRVAVLVTDCWDGAAWKEWRGNFQQIGQDAHIEIYLMTGAATISEIQQ